MTTQLLVISDTHLGYRQYQSNQRREDFAAAFDEAIDIALGEHPRVNDTVDAVVHLGDLFDDRSPSTGTFEKCLETTSRLSDADVPFLGIIGNHERKRDTDWLDLMTRLNESVTHLTQTGTIVNEEVILYGIDAVTDAQWGTHDFTLTPPTGAVADEYVNIACMHQLFHPPIPNPLAAEHELEPLLPELDVPVDSIAIGDYHDHVSKTVEGVRTFYPGSTERTAKGQEQGSATLLTADAGSMPPIVTEPIWLNSREFVSQTVTFGVGDGLTEAKQRLSDIRPDGRVVTVQLEGEPVPVGKEQLQTYLYNQGATVVRITDNRHAPSVSTAKEQSAAVTETDSKQALEDAIEDVQLSPTGEIIEDTVRNTDGVAKSNVDAEAQEILQEQFTDKFEANDLGGVFQ